MFHFWVCALTFAILSQKSGMVATVEVEKIIIGLEK